MSSNPNNFDENIVIIVMVVVVFFSGLTQSFILFFCYGTPIEFISVVSHFGADSVNEYNIYLCISHVFDLREV